MKLFKKKKSRYDILKDKLKDTKDLRALSEQMEELSRLFVLERLKMQVNNHKALIGIHSFNFILNSVLLLFFTNSETNIFTTGVRILIIGTASFILYMEIKKLKRDKTDLVKEMLKWGYSD